MYTAFTVPQRDALRIAAEIVHPHPRRGRRRDTFADARDVAAAACGMVHRDRHLLMPVSAGILLRSRQMIPEDQPCVIRSITPHRPDPVVGGR